MDEFHTVDELAKMMKICRQTVTKLIKTARLEAVNVGSKKRPTWKIHDGAYQKFLSECYEEQKKNK